jgi:hypothetical protein
VLERRGVLGVVEFLAVTAVELLGVYAVALARGAVVARCSAGSFGLPDALSRDHAGPLPAICLS